jgi:CHASE2 domain-containing sensor protein
MNEELAAIRNRLRSQWDEVSTVVKRGLFALVVGCLPILFSGTLTESGEPRLLRLWFTVRPERETPPSVTLVRLDKRAYDAAGLIEGQLFSRRHLAIAIQKIAAAGAKMIVLDMIFEQERDDPEANRLLARALASSPSVIGRHTEELTDVAPDGTRRTTRVLVKPLELFAESAQMVIPLELRLTNDRSEEICLSNERDFFSDVPVPLLEALRHLYSPYLEQPGGFDYINFYGGPDTLASISLAGLITPGQRVPDEYFRDRVVLIGAAREIGVSAAGRSDSFRTSYSNERMFGVEIHGTIAANLIDGTWIRRLPIQAETLLMGLVAFVLAFTVSGAGPIGAPLWALGLSGLWLAVSYVAFSQFYHLIPAYTVLLTVVPLVVALRWGALVLKHVLREHGSEG